LHTDRAYKLNPRGFKRGPESSQRVVIAFSELSFSFDPLERVFG
jgi:hypothetical protein